jgi:hypothetical protein
MKEALLWFLSYLFAVAAGFLLGYIVKGRLW